MNDDFHNAMLAYVFGVLVIMLVTVIVLTMLDCGKSFPALIEYIYSHPF